MTSQDFEYAGEKMYGEKTNEATTQAPARPPPRYSFVETSDPESPSSDSEHELPNYDPMPPRSAPVSHMHGVVPMNAPGPASLAATNGVFIETRRDAIAGTFILDPTLPLPADAQSRSCHKRRRGAPNAVFQSRHGRITVDLAVIGVGATPARISASTRRGSIFVKLMDKSVDQPVEIDTRSRHGDTTVLLPPTFSGIVEIRTCHGTVETLPGLAHSVRTVTSARREVRFIVGAGPEAGGRDYAKLEARHGKLRVGSSIADAPVKRL